MNFRLKTSLIFICILVIGCVTDRKNKSNLVNVVSNNQDLILKDLHIVHSLYVDSFNTHLRINIETRQKYFHGFWNELLCQEVLDRIGINENLFPKNDTLIMSVWYFDPREEARTLVTNLDFIDKIHINKSKTYNFALNSMEPSDFQLFDHIIFSLEKEGKNHGYSDFETILNSISNSECIDRNIVTLLDSVNNRYPKGDYSENENQINFFKGLYPMCGKGSEVEIVDTNVE